MHMNYSNSIESQNVLNNLRGCRSCLDNSLEDKVESCMTLQTIVRLEVSVGNGVKVSCIRASEPNQLPVPSNSCSVIL